MEISANMNSQAANISNNHDTAVEAGRRADRQSSVEAATEKFNGEQLKGRILDISNNETPPVVTVKLLSGETVKASAELPEGARTGDYVKFIMQAGEGGQKVMHGVSLIDPKTATDPKLALMAKALETAGLKVDEANLKLVSLLMKNELPINKESITAFSKMVRFAGMESSQKAVLLMNNDMPLTIGTLEKLNAHMNDGGKLLNQIRTLAEKIMEMENGPEKQKLLQVFLDLTQDAAETAPGKPHQAQTSQTTTQTTQTAQAAQANVQNTQTNMQSIAQNTAQTAQTAQADGSAPQPAQSAQAQITADTGTKFFREIFNGKQEAQAHLVQNPPTTETKEFIEKNLSLLKSGFEEMSRNGTVTKEGIINLVKSAAAQTGAQIPFNAESGAELKSFVLSLADKSGLLDESIEKAGHFERAVKDGAKKIVERLSVSLDDEKPEIEKAVENIKQKLSLAAGALGDGKDAESVRQGIEEIKESLKFLSNFKNNTFVQIPIVLDGQQKQAELYVFPRKGGKNKGRNSHSALVALDLANLGHFETYIQKTEKSVVCQFRLESGDVEELVKENIGKLHNALKDKQLSLDGVIFKKTDEKFKASDEEPSIDEVAEATDTKNGKFSFDYKT